MPENSVAERTTAIVDARRGSLSADQQAFHSVRDLLSRAEAQLAAALPKHIPASYMIRVVLTAVQRTPDLLKCEPITLLGAVFQAAQLALVPDGVLGQAYLVPFNNRKKNRKEVQFIPGYRGLITLVRRSGELSTIDAEVVREKDIFEYVRGTNPTIKHVPSEEANPGKIVKVYAVARLKDGGFQIKVMNRREVEAIKARSAAVKSGHSSPWDTDEEWMFKKTCLKQLTKLLPASIESQRAINLDDRAESGLPQDLALLADPDNETATPEEEGAQADTIDSLESELGLIATDLRRPIEVAFDQLEMNKAQRLVQVRAFKGRPAELIAMLRGMVDARGGGSAGTTAPASDGVDRADSSPPPPAVAAAVPAAGKSPFDF